MLEQLFTFNEREIMNVICDERTPLVVRHCASIIFEKDNMIQAVKFTSELKEVVYGNTKDAKETKE